MNVRQTNWISALAAGIAVVAMGAASSHAVGTAAATSVSNRAVVSFDAGGGPETVESSPTGNSTPGANQGSDTAFLVDQMVDLSVSEVDGAYTLVMPGDTLQALGFNVSNTGNASQDIAFLTENTVTDPFPPGPDDFDVTNITPATYYIDDGDGVFEPGVDDGAPVAHLDAVGADVIVFVWVAVDIPAGQTPGETAGVVLVAEARIDDGAGSLGGIMTPDADGDDPALVEILFADGDSTLTPSDIANDGRFADADAVLVEAELTVTKTSTVFSDPVRCTDQENPLTCGSPPLAIPGAYLEYTITIDNQSASVANSVQVTDSLAAMIAAGNIAFRSGAFVNPTHGIRFRINGGAWTDVTDANDPDPGDFGATPDTVTLNLPALGVGDVAEVQFQVVLQ